MVGVITALVFLAVIAFFIFLLSPNEYTETLLYGAVGLLLFFLLPVVVGRFL